MELYGHVFSSYTWKAQIALHAEDLHALAALDDAPTQRVLRLEADGLKLLKRKILIPNAMLLCKNINTFL